jgi:hypothetical protein
MSMPTSHPWQVAQVMRAAMLRLGLVEPTNLAAIDAAREDQAAAATPSPRARRA